MQLMYITIAAGFLLAVLFVGIYYLIFKGPQRIVAATKDGTIDAANQCYDLAARIGADVKEALGFQPRISVRNVTVLNGSSSRSDYVTAQRDFSHTTRWEQTWCGSTLALELRGRFEAIAGFTLDESFEISIDEGQRVVRVRHAAARLISCELKQIEFLKEEGGLWNWVKPVDREAAQNALLNEAREAINTSDLLLKAQENLTERLGRLTARHSLRLENQGLPAQMVG